MNTNKFNDLLSDVEGLSVPETFKVLLHLREIGAGDIDQLAECKASYNSLDEDNVVALVKYIRKQFDEETWNTILDLTEV